ncbi:hypothetical protein [Cupriavidus sp. HMR-1]|uniref:hypothetical protein n=1 Tax=Cupriavidus sp. HMR-1 TaxID=1249621 RepID=UPI000310A871|nr:hypothetical protein [Cupriavidus sp. HMR-1]
MKKKIVVALFVSILSVAAHAESWHVVVTASYLNSKNLLVKDAPVLDATVDESKCFTGETRTTQMIHGPVKSTKQICVHRDGERAIFDGFVFPQQPIEDLPFPGDRGAKDRGELSYGVPVSASLIGRYLQMSFGHYTLTATRK